MEKNKLVIFVAIMVSIAIAAIASLFIGATTQNYLLSNVILGVAVGLGLLSLFVLVSKRK